MFVKSPNLPKNKVSLVVVSKKNEFLTDDFKKLSVGMIFTSPINSLPKCENDHADMQMIHLSDNKIIVRNDCMPLAKALSERGFSVSFCEKNGVSYPESASLNALFVGKYLLGNLKYVEKGVLDFCEQNGILPVNTKQGYTKCASCVVNENAVITADPSVYNSLKGKADVLKISPDGILLDGKDGGFIGGASVLIDKDKLMFCGNVSAHKDFENIKSFLLNHKIDMIYNKNYPLTDVGSPLPIKTL